VEQTDGFHKLIVYQKAKKLVVNTYAVTKNFPSLENHGLTSQLRRAIVSVAANIVEGYSKSSTKDFIRYLDISLGSLAESDFYFELSLELKYLDQNTYNELSSLSLEVRKLLRSFQKSLRAKERG
jgi:four helix bundle protein